MSDEIKRWSDWVWVTRPTGGPALESASIALAAAKWRDRYRAKLSQAKTAKYRLAINATLRVIDDILIGEGPCDE